MNNPIFITGAPRSGKTMIAGILDICGVFLGTTDSMLENIAIRDRLIKPYLMYHGGHSSGLKQIPETCKLTYRIDWVDKVEGILEEQGYDGSQKWMFKSAKVALTWPVWNRAFPNAKYIIVRRRTGDIIQSCLKTGYMKAYDNKEGWKTMVHQYENKFVEMISEGLNCKVIWPHRMVHGDYGQIYELLEWLGLPWKTEILNHIDPKFWKTRKKEKSWQDQ